MAGRSRPGSLSLNTRMILRQLGSQPAVVVSILVTVAISLYLIGVAPRAVEDVAGRDLRATVTEPLPAQRNIRVEQQARISSGAVGDRMARVRDIGGQFASTQFPPSVNAVISDHYYLVDSPQFQILPMPGEDPPHPFKMLLRYRYQEGVEDRLTLVEGAMPAPQEPIPMLVGGECPEDEEGRTDLMELLSSEGPPDDFEIECDLEDVPHFQVAITAKTREALGLGTGHFMLLRPNPTDRLFFGMSSEELGFSVVMSISGIIELGDVTEEYWYGDNDLHRPGIEETADFRIIFATGLMAPDDYSAMMQATGLADRQYVWRYFVDPDLVEVADVEQLESDLRALQLHYSVIAARNRDPRVITQLPDLLRLHLEQRLETLAMMSTSLLALFSVVASVIVVLAILMTQRQRSAIVLMRGRGASKGQLALTRLYQALIIAVPGAVLGYQAAASLFPKTEDLIAYRAAVGLTTAAIVALVLTSVPVLRHELGDLLGQAHRITSRRSPRRWVMDGLILVVAAGAIVLLRRRGQIEEPGNGEFDLLLAAAPAIIAVATGVVTIRFYPILIGAMAWLGSRTRGLVGLVGFRRVLQQPLGERLPVMAIVLCVATAGFAAVGKTTISMGQEASSWQAVGADYTIKSRGNHVNLPASVDVRAYQGVDALALGTTFAGAQAVLQTAASRTQVLAVDATGYGEVTSGTPGDPLIPEVVKQPPASNTGTPDRPIPALVSPVWPRGIQFGVGDTFVLDLGRLKPTLVVAAIRDRFPDLGPELPFVVLDRAALQSLSDLPIQPTVAYLRAPEPAGARLTEVVAGQSGSVVVTSRYETLELLTEDPFVAFVDTGLGVIFIFAVVLAVVAAVSSLAFASARRRRDFAYLRTMGMVTPQATTMTVIEQFPAVLIATAIGVVTGAAMALMLEPAIAYEAFTGDLVPIDIEVDWVTMALATVALIGTLALSIVIFVTSSRDDELGRALRVGDE